MKSTPQWWCALNGPAILFFAAEIVGNYRDVPDEQHGDRESNPFGQMVRRHIDGTRGVALKKFDLDFGC